MAKKCVYDWKFSNVRCWWQLRATGDFVSLPTCCCCLWLSLIFVCLCWSCQVSGHVIIVNPPSLFASVNRYIPVICTTTYSTNTFNLNFVTNFKFVEVNKKHITGNNLYQQKWMVICFLENLLKIIDNN